MENINGNKIKITLVIFCAVIFFFNCKKDSIKVFELNSSASQALEKNVECFELLKGKMGIDEAILSRKNYFDEFLEKVIIENKNKNFKRFVYLRNVETEGAIIIRLFTIGILPNGNAIITKYLTENGDSKRIEKVINNFDINDFYKNLNLSSSHLDRLSGKLFMIDFESNEICNCSFYWLDNGHKLDDFSFFKS